MIMVLLMPAPRATPTPMHPAPRQTPLTRPDRPETKAQNPGRPTLPCWVLDKGANEKVLTITVGRSGAQKKVRLKARK